MTFNIIYKIPGDPIHLHHGSIEADTMEEAIEHYPCKGEKLEFISVSLDHLVNAYYDATRWNRLGGNPPKTISLQG